METELTYSFNAPTEIELLRIFEGSGLDVIIQSKIDDWLRIKGKIFCKEILPVLQRIAKVKDDFSRWFWLEAYKTCYLPEKYKLALSNLERLHRLKLIATTPKYASKIENRDRSKAIAKETPILSLYGFRKLRRTGTRHTALCPFHNEKTPSFVIYADQNSYHCFGCGANGDSISFIQKLKDCSFNDAIGFLAGVSR